MNDSLRRWHRSWGGDGCGRSRGFGGVSSYYSGIGEVRGIIRWLTVTNPPLPSAMPLIGKNWAMVVRI